MRATGSAQGSAVLAALWWVGLSGAVLCASADALQGHLVAARLRSALTTAAISVARRTAWPSRAGEATFWQVAQANLGPHLPLVPGQFQWVRNPPGSVPAWRIAASASVAVSPWIPLPGYFGAAYAVIARTAAP